MKKTDYSNYKYFKGEKECPFDMYEMIYIWEIEKQAYEKGCTFDEQKKLMQDSIKHTKNHIGIEIDYPYEGL